MAYFNFDNINDYEFYYCIYVKTTKHETIEKMVWSGFSFDQFNRWRWYFDYRAALEKVKNPRFHIETTFGRNVKKIEDLEKNKKNKIRACKAKITEMENKLKRVLAQESSELFSLAEHPLTVKFQKKLDDKRIELAKYQEFDLESFRRNNRWNEGTPGEETQIVST